VAARAPAHDRLLINSRAVVASHWHHLPVSPCIGFESLDDLLDDSCVELVLNLTNPRSRYAVIKACLEAGKHIYTAEVARCIRAGRLSRTNVPLDDTIAILQTIAALRDSWKTEGA
jgi:hypothetical protein